MQEVVLGVEAGQGMLGHAHPSGDCKSSGVAYGGTRVPEVETTAPRLNLKASSLGSWAPSCLNQRTGRRWARM